MSDFSVIAPDFGNDHKSLDDVIQLLIDYLGSIDLDKLNAQDLNTYAFTLKTVNEMRQPGYTELLTTMLTAGRRDEVRDG